jgi:Mn-dependent DtxR family transcriptional regulator
MNPLTPSERIVLKAAYKIGQVERGVSVITDNRRQHWRTIDSLNDKGLLRYINHQSAILTENGFIIAEALATTSEALTAEIAATFDINHDR